jgi:phosphopantothenoylcysteine decarboxylase / phosphopantothenate---cysteine ligase
MLTAASPSPFAEAAVAGSQPRILVVLTGSIAAYKACDVISKLVQAGAAVQAVATASALRMVGAATLEGLTGRRVLSDLWEPGTAMEHIQLTRWADLVLVCPATAATINRLASGLADDLVGTLFLAHDRRKPWLVAPAMNPAMWSHPATVAAVDRLRDFGVRFLPVAEGRTACGEVGEGRLIEPPEIVAAVLAALAPPARRLRVLVTSGGTEEPVDGVRVLTNRSTGYTGSLLASRLAARGHRVVLLRARSAVRPGPGVEEEAFGSFADLDAALGRRLGGEDFDAILHAAAVSDFSVGEVRVDGVARAPGGKIDSRRPVELRLVVNPKLVTALRARSRNPALRVVAFKLTDHADPGAIARAVATLREEAGPDAIVHNDLADQGSAAEAFPSTLHRFAAGAGEPLRCGTRTALAKALEDLLLSLTAPKTTQPSP